MITKLIDLSHWNNKVDWDKIKADKVDGVYLKCTQGIGFFDPMCVSHATQAKAHGIPLGYYHFATLTNDVNSEVNFFNSKLSSLPVAELMPVLDIEENKAGYNSAQVESWMKTFMDTLGKEAMIYSYTDFLNTNLPITHGFGQYKLFIAQYRNIQAPLLPRGWVTADLWQFTNLGKINGIDGTVDISKPITQNFVL